MNGSNSKIENLERKYPLYRRAKVNTRRKYSSISQLDLLEIVGSVARIQTFLDQGMEYTGL